MRRTHRCRTGPPGVAPPAKLSAPFTGPSSGLAVTAAARGADAASVLALHPGRRAWALRGGSSRRRRQGGPGVRDEQQLQSHGMGWSNLGRTSSSGGWGLGDDVGDRVCLVA